MSAAPLWMAIYPDLGRFDYHSLSDQIFSELIVDGFNAEKKKSIKM